MVVAERGAHREGTAAVVVVAAFLEGGVHRVALPRVPVHLRLGQGSRQVLLAPHVAQVELHGDAAGQPVAEARVRAAPELLAVLAGGGEAGGAPPHPRNRTAPEPARARPG